LFNVQDSAPYVVTGWGRLHSLLVSDISLNDSYSEKFFRQTL
jgi:hypothetical protein